MLYLSYQYNENHTQVKISAKFLSNPTKEDTDWDEISDAEELIIGTSPTSMDTDGDDLSINMVMIHLLWTMTMMDVLIIRSI